MEQVSMKNRLDVRGGTDIDFKYLALSIMPIALRVSQHLQSAPHDFTPLPKV